MEDYTDFLTEDGLKIFHEIIAHLKENNLHKPIDFFEVAVVANAFEIYRLAAKNINENGYKTPPAQSGYQSVNPDFTVMKECFAQINKGSSKLLLNADSRQRLFKGQLDRKKKINVTDDLD